MEKREKIPGKILKLDETVINRIAAGEVIQRPANALKELLENALDAGADNIQVVVKNGGLKLLQIQDDGSGIRECDLPILCERFTTSKLSKFEDLLAIGTYGFRGEALASISHVAHLSVVTKTRESPCAFRAEYVDGRLKEYGAGSGVQNPKKCAGKQGTTIIVEDLFYNMDTRRKALNKGSEEHNKVTDVVTKYAVHNCKVGFSLKKFGETMTDVKTQPGSSSVENIKVLYGAAIARELIPVSCESEGTKFKMSGYVSNVNYNTRKLTFILFINNRLVECTALKKSIEAVYANYLPKGTHPFLYISVDVNPQNVDVNVHPTKHEVHFLHEESIVADITSAIENVLLGANESRTFLVQSLLPGANVPIVSTASESNSRKRKEIDFDPAFSSPHQRNDPKNMVRTDPKMQKLDRFLCSTPNPDISTLRSFHDSPSKLEFSSEDKNSAVVQSYSQPTTLPKEVPAAGNESPANRPSTVIGSSCSTEPSAVAPPKKREMRLRSVQNMRTTIEQECHRGLMNIFKNLTFVGCVDRKLSLFQHETKLYICNVNKLSQALFYQKLVANFGNFRLIRIDDPIELKELIDIGLNASLHNQSNSATSTTESQLEANLIDEMFNLLMSKRKMLEDYFSLKFDDDGRLVCLPLLIDNYFPFMEGLPAYVVSLAEKVVWTNEQKCFETFCEETAKFYAIPVGSATDNNETALNGQTWKWIIEHLIFPEFKKTFLPPKIFASDSSIVQLTSLPELYRVFERC